MAKENLLTYTEVDNDGGGGNFVIAQNRVDFTGQMNYDYHLYKDFGAGYFPKGFPAAHQFEAFHDSGYSALGAWIWLISESNHGAYVDLRSASDPYVYLGPWTSYVIRLGYDLGAPAGYGTSALFVLGTVYYWDVEITDGGTNGVLYAVGHDDSDRTSVVDTIAKNLGGAFEGQYYHAFAGHNSTSSSQHTGYVADHDLQLPATVSLGTKLGSKLVERVNQENELGELYRDMYGRLAESVDFRLDALD